MSSAFDAGDGKIDAPPTAQADIAAYLIASRAANPAGFSEALAKKLGFGQGHPAKMEGDARDTTADLVRGPRADRRLGRKQA